MLIVPDAPADGAQGADKPAESKVVTGLGWLLRHQDADGGWHDPATTGTVLLVFLGVGETPQNGSRRETVKKALTSLIAGQDAEGCLVVRTSSRSLRDHAIASLALCEA